MPSRQELPPDEAITLVPPSPEETKRQHDYFLQEHGIQLANGQDLGTALASLNPRTEYMVRGLGGLYPFGSKQSEVQLAKRLNIRPENVQGTQRRALHALSVGPIAKPATGEVYASLEDLGRLAHDEPQHVTPEQLQLVLELRGLAPFNRPTSAAVIAERLCVSAETVREHARSTIRQLLGIHTERLQKPRIPKTVIAEYAQRRDTGIYAAMLCHFAKPETREAWAAILERDLERAAVLREQRRTRLAAQKRRLLEFSNTGHRKPTDQLDAKRGFNPNLDTAVGRAALVEAIAVRAAYLTSEDVADLALVIQDGKHAEQQMIEGGIPLVFFGASLVMKHTGVKYHHRDLLAAGFEGLQQRPSDSMAKWGFRLLLTPQR
ncbi:MAG TPA: hypothetical protein VLE73_00215 [Candidatus Saccharimonadales bacterium]|nr:hypothetical protein [Candidatus Saccharimonadales bacterium]